VANHAAGREPAGPTTAAPGTAAKIEVMEARAKAGESLFHPADPRERTGASRLAPFGALFRAAELEVW
jgi:hypothetical protein